jgi:hypothetical protein
MDLLAGTCERGFDRKKEEKQSRHQANDPFFESAYFHIDAVIPIRIQKAVVFPIPAPYVVVKIYALFMKKAGRCENQAGRLSFIETDTAASAVFQLKFLQVSVFDIDILKSLHLPAHFLHRMGGTLVLSGADNSEEPHGLNPKGLCIFLRPENRFHPPRWHRLFHFSKRPD